MSTIEKQETKIATDIGFHGGHRVRPGGTFLAPVAFTGKWFASAGTKTEAVQEVLAAKTNVLEMTATEVKELAPSMTSQAITEAIDAEAGSGKRKNVMNILKDELANRVGQIGGPDPAAKSPDEKDQQGSQDALLS